MRGFLHGSKIIFQERGIRGFFQGFVPTTARQAANSATRFTSYTTLKQFAEGYVAPGEKLGTLSTFAIGGVAGLITVYVLGGSNGRPTRLADSLPIRYVTQPLDTVKTRSVYGTLSRCSGISLTIESECNLSKQARITRTALSAPRRSSSTKAFSPFGPGPCLGWPD